jgi:hypothetical protein
MPYIRENMDFSPASIALSIDKSLTRLQTDYIDLYQLHWPERKANFFGQRGFKVQDDAWEDNIHGVLETLDGFIKQGKINHIGLSNETPWGMMRFLEESKYHNLPRIATVQNPYSLLSRLFEVGSSEICMRENVGLLAYSPLGFGILTTAIKADLLDMRTIKKVAESMKTLNYKASLIAREFNAHACTDVTGFGLLGHLREMSGGRKTIEVESASVPFFSEALEMANMGIIPAGSYANKEYLHDKVRFCNTIDANLEMILFDAQTSGGLLIAVAASSITAMVQRCLDEGLDVRIVAQVLSRGDVDIEVK